MQMVSLANANLARFADYIGNRASRSHAFDALGRPKLTFARM